jgi:hypothetical protein
MDCMSRELAEAPHSLRITVWVGTRVCQEILTENLTCASLLLHHNNIPAHTSLKATEFVTNNNMVIIPHPPCSSDLVSCDFALFPKLKMKLKR